MKLEDVGLSEGVVRVLLEESHDVSEVFRFVDFADVGAVWGFVAENNRFGLGEAKGGVLDSVGVIDHLGDFALRYETEQGAPVARDGVVFSLELGDAIFGRGVDHKFSVAKSWSFVKTLREYLAILA